MNNLSIWAMIWNAGVVVKFVMLILFTASITSWTIIIQRIRLFKLAWREYKSFETQFWSGIDLNKLYNDLSTQENLSGLSLAFYQGFGEFLRLRKQPQATPEVILAGTQRAWYVAQSRQVEYLETNLGFLATVGSTSPYVGLFGTVWGIMTSFTALGGMQQATISMVAPGISEALVATAIGLFAAIPAVIAYNRFSNDLAKLTNYYENFREEFINILQRKLHSE